MFHTIVSLIMIALGALFMFLGVFATHTRGALSRIGNGPPPTTPQKVIFFVIGALLVGKGVSMFWG